ncbi:MAG: response regulator [Candidatus Sumerlaeaceae bacterium]
MIMILVIDDEPAIASAIKTVLELSGMAAVVAGSCDEALAIINRTPPELIFSDINMPDRSGLDLLHTLKANPATAHIPLVFITGEARNQDVNRGLAAGAAGYLKKPFSPPELLNTVRALVHRAG